MTGALSSIAREMKWLIQQAHELCIYTNMILMHKRKKDPIISKCKVSILNLVVDSDMN